MSERRKYFLRLDVLGSSMKGRSPCFAHLSTVWAEVSGSIFATSDADRRSCGSSGFLMFMN